MRYTDTKQCKQCSEVFIRPDSYTNRNVWNKKLFCSKQCRGASERTSVEKQCQQCNKQMLVEQNLLKSKKYCSNACRIAGFNPVFTEESRRKIAEAHKGKPKINMPRGEKHHMWKGGKGTERHQAMARSEYKSWRTAVFARDDYTCVCCSATRTYLHADHIVGWSEDEALRYEVKNGQTLCYKCHYKKTFGVLNEDKAILWGVPKQFRGGVS